MEPNGPVDKTLEVGVGRNEFTALSPMSAVAVEIVKGAQGEGRFLGFHIWSALRFHELELETISVIKYAIYTPDGVEQAYIERDPTLVTTERDEEGRLLLLGLSPRLIDCCAAAETRLRMRAEVQLIEGAALEAEGGAMSGACAAECP